MVHVHPSEQDRQKSCPSSAWRDSGTLWWHRFITACHLGVRQHLNGFWSAFKPWWPLVAHGHLRGSMFHSEPQPGLHHVSQMRMSHSPIYIMMLLLCYIRTRLNHPAWLLEEPHLWLSTASSVAFPSGVFCFRVTVPHLTAADSRNSLILNSGQKPSREDSSPKSKASVIMQICGLEWTCSTSLPNISPLLVLPL